MCNSIACVSTELSYLNILMDSEAWKIQLPASFVRFIPSWFLIDLYRIQYDVTHTNTPKKNDLVQEYSKE
jgi:hypothetical protein